MKQTVFFALEDDLIPALRLVDAGAPMNYVRMGNFVSPQIETYARGEYLPGLGVADSGTAATCTSYLVCHQGTRINVRFVAGAGGANRHIVDQLINPASVVFAPAGMWKGEIILLGRVSTVSDTAESGELMKRFGSAIRKFFKNVKGNYVGPTAYTWLRDGRRLTISEQSPPDFDLKRPT